MEHGPIASFEGAHFDPAPRVALPPARARRADAARHEPVYLVDDDRVARLVADRLGAIAVAPSHLYCLPEAGHAAARLAGGRPVVVGFRRSRVLDGQLETGRRFARAAAAVEAAGGRAVLPILPAEGSIEEEIAARRPLRFAPLAAADIRLPGTATVATRPLAATVDALRRRIRAALERQIRASGDALDAAAASLGAPGERYAAVAAIAADVAAEAARRGIPILAIGGFGADLHAGCAVRDRKDVDFVLPGADGDALDALAERAERAGYVLDARVPGRMARLDRGPARVELFVLPERPGGRYELLTPSMHVLLPRDLAGPLRRIPGHAQRVRPIAADLLLALKGTLLDDVETCFPRTELALSAGNVLDVAALRRAAGTDDHMAVVRSGRIAIVVCRPDRHARAAHLLRETVGRRLGRPLRREEAFARAA